MPTDVERLVVRIEANQRQFERQLKSINRNVSRTTQDMERRFTKANKTSAASFGDFEGRAGASLTRTATLAAGVAAAVTLIGTAVVSAAKRGESLLILEKRLEAITGNSDRAKASLAAIQQIAAEVGVNIDTVAGAFSRYTIASEQIGATTEEVEELTQNILKLGAISGASGTEISAGAQQLGQSLAKGVLNGDELRSVMENIPLVAKQIADGLDVGIGRLKEMGAAGELTSQKVFDALLKGSEDVNKSFANLPNTIERASARMSNAWTNFTARLNESVGASEKIANTLDALAAKLEQGGLSGDGLKLFNLKAEVKEAEGALQDLIENARNSATNILGNFSQEKFDNILASSTSIQEVQRNIANTTAQINEIEGRISEKKAEQSDYERARAIALGREKSVKETQAALDEVTRQQELRFQTKRIQAIERAGAAAVAALKEQAPYASPAELKKVEDAARDAEAKALDLENSLSNVNGLSFDGAIAEANRLSEALGISVGLAARLASFGDQGVPSSGPKYAGRGGDPRKFGDNATERSIFRDTGGISVDDFVKSKYGSGGSSGGGSSGGGEEFDPLESLKRTNEELKIQIATLGLSTAAAAEYRAVQEALAAATENGINLDSKSAEVGLTVREAITAKAASVRELTEQYEQGQLAQEKFEKGVSDIGDAFADAIVSGGSLRDSFKSILDDIARDIISSGIKNLLTDQFKPSGGGSGGGLFGVIGGLLGFEKGGFTGNGGRKQVAGVVHGGEYVFDKGATDRIGVKNLEALRAGSVPGFMNGGFVGSPASVGVSTPTGASGSMQSKVSVDVFVRDNGALGAIAREEGRNAALPVAVRVVEENNKTIPAMVSEAQRRS